MLFDPAGSKVTVSPFILGISDRPIKNSTTCDTEPYSVFDGSSKKHYYFFIYLTFLHERVTEGAYNVIVVFNGFFAVFSIDKNGSNSVTVAHTFYWRFDGFEPLLISSVLKWNVFWRFFIQSRYWPLCKFEFYFFKCWLRFKWETVKFTQNRFLRCLHLCNVSETKVAYSI